MECQLDIFFLEAVLNGLLLAGLLALLALGLNLIFGVIDVVWICYAELVMVGMYGINYAYKAGAPFLAAALFGVLLVALAGAILHQLVIRPVLDAAPINQLLVTGGMVLRGDFHGALDRNAIPIDQLDTRHEGGVMKARDGFRDDILPFVSFKAGLHLERQEGSHLGKVSGQNVVCVQVA